MKALLWCAVGLMLFPTPAYPQHQNSIEQAVAAITQNVRSLRGRSCTVQRLLRILFCKCRGPCTIRESVFLRRHQVRSRGYGPHGTHGSQREPYGVDASRRPSSGTEGQGGEDDKASHEEPGHRRFTAQLTFASGYLALGLLALTLLIGSANLLLGRRLPVSNYLARDVGTWAAIFSVVRTVVGLQVHGPPGPSPLGERMLRYFFGPDRRPLTNSFGLANWTGLAATVIVMGLLAISSDAALRKLKAGLWKRLQRLNYALFALVVLHAFFYGAFLRSTSPFTALLLIIIGAVVFGQAAGVWLWRRRAVFPRPNVAK